MQAPGVEVQIRQDCLVPAVMLTVSFVGFRSVEAC